MGTALAESPSITPKAMKPLRKVTTRSDGRTQRHLSMIYFAFVILVALELPVLATESHDTNLYFTQPQTITRQQRPIISTRVTDPCGKCPAVLSDIAAAYSRQHNSLECQQFLRKLYCSVNCNQGLLEGRLKYKEDKTHVLLPFCKDDWKRLARACHMRRAGAYGADDTAYNKPNFNSANPSSNYFTTTRDINPLACDEMMLPPFLEVGNRSTLHPYASCGMPEDHCLAFPDIFRLTANQAWQLRPSPARHVNTPRVQIGSIHPKSHTTRQPFGTAFNQVEGREDPVNNATASTTSAPLQPAPVSDAPVPNTNTTLPIAPAPTLQATVTAPVATVLQPVVAPLNPASPQLAVIYGSPQPSQVAASPIAGLAAYPDAALQSTSESVVKNEFCFNDCKCLPYWIGSFLLFIGNLALLGLALYWTSLLFSKGFISNSFFNGGAIWLLSTAAAGGLGGALLGGLVLSCVASGVATSGFALTFAYSMILVGKRGALFGGIGGTGLGAMIGVLTSLGTVAIVSGAFLGLLLGVILGFFPIASKLKMNERYIREGFSDKERQATQGKRHTWSHETYSSGADKPPFGGRKLSDSTKGPGTLKLKPSDNSRRHSTGLADLHEKVPRQKDTPKESTFDTESNKE